MIRSTALLTEKEDQVVEEDNMLHGYCWYLLNSHESDSMKPRNETETQF